jgi:hypothetical protein
MGFESTHAFAWVPIEVDEDHVLVTVIERGALTGLILSTALLAAVASDMLSRRPIEAYATRIQTGYLERMATRLDGPGDPIMHIAREDLEELRIGAELIVVNRHDGSIADGPEDALTESERAWIVRGGGVGTNSMGFESTHAFAWVPIEVDEDHVLVTVIERGALTGGMGALPGPRRRHDRLTPAQ